MFMRPIALSGFMGTGKSTLGKALAGRLGVSFVDTDAEVEKEAGLKIPEIFAREGEGGFRIRELRAVRAALESERPGVVALGGGAVTQPEARRFITDRALVVTLTAEPKTSIERIRASGDLRPLLQGPDPEGSAKVLLEHRAAAYAEAHLSLATDDLAIDDAIDAIVALVERDPVLVPLGERSYAIDFVVDRPSLLTDAIGRLGPTKLVVVTDSHVWRARKNALEAALHPLEIVPRIDVTLAPGEVHKTLAQIATIWDAALGAEVDREAVVVAFGGGVVGDLAGFAASTLLRGVRFVQSPTTLLAMVDASVGGKTGFDHATGKNLVGSFHQPSGVVIDLAHLATLPPRETKAGLAEVVKIALATDESLLVALEDAADGIAKGDVELLATIVRSAVAAKVRVVRDDEREAGARALLNLGHTLGHALETCGNYTRWLHGEAVAIGLVHELAITTAWGNTDPAVLPRTRSLLARLGLPDTAAKADLERASALLGSDKKKVGLELKLPIVTAPGKAIVKRVRIDALASAIRESSLR